MNSKQKREVIKLLMADCEIADKYLFRGKTCALGCLALAAKVPKRLLTGRNVSLPIEVLPKVSDRIQSKFGLSLKHQTDIQCVNDIWATDVDERRERVVRVVKSIRTYERTK